LFVGWRFHCTSRSLVVSLHIYISIISFFIWIIVIELQYLLFVWNMFASAILNHYVFGESFIGLIAIVIWRTLMISRFIITWMWVLLYHYWDRCSYAILKDLHLLFCLSLKLIGAFNIWGWWQIGWVSFFDWL